VANPAGIVLASLRERTGAEQDGLDDVLNVQPAEVALLEELVELLARRLERQRSRGGPGRGAEANGRRIA
jgi:hypothetical protein